MDGGTRSHKAGCRLDPPRPLTMFISIPLVKSDLKTRPETRCKPLLPHFVLSAVPLYPESGMHGLLQYVIIVKSFRGSYVAGTLIMQSRIIN